MPAPHSSVGGGLIFFVLIQSLTVLVETPNSFAASEIVLYGTSLTFITVGTVCPLQTFPTVSMYRIPRTCQTVRTFRTLGPASRRRSPKFLSEGERWWKGCPWSITSNIPLSDKCYCTTKVVMEVVYLQQLHRGHSQTRQRLPRRMFIYGALPRICEKRWQPSVAVTVVSCKAFTNVAVQSRPHPQMVSGYDARVFILKGVSQVRNPIRVHMGRPCEVLPKSSDRVLA
jgi:hypothetical protein